MDEHEIWLASQCEEDKKCRTGDKISNIGQAIQRYEAYELNNTISAVLQARPHPVCRPGNQRLC
jgi:hypothetical protein